MKRKNKSRRKTLIIYYSYTGVTKKLAWDLAKKRSAALCEIRDTHKPHILQAYTVGCFRALMHKETEIQPICADFSSYDKLVIMFPIWAGRPAPPIHHVFDMLPAGKDVEIYMISGSGKSQCQQMVRDLMKQKRCRVVKCVDRKRP